VRRSDTNATTHYFAPDGHAPPAKTQGCTAVSPRLLIRMRPLVQVQPGPLQAPDQQKRWSVLLGAPAGLDASREGMKCELRFSSGRCYPSDQFLRLFEIPRRPGGLGRTAVEQRITALLRPTDCLPQPGGGPQAIGKRQGEGTGWQVSLLPRHQPGCGSAVRLGTSTASTGGLVGPAGEEFVPFLLGEAAAGDGAGPLEPGGGVHVP
jgi:hypothetical protein